MVDAGTDEDASTSSTSLLGRVFLLPLPRFFRPISSSRSLRRCLSSARTCVWSSGALNFVEVGLDDFGDDGMVDF